MDRRSVDGLDQLLPDGLQVDLVVELMEVMVRSQDLILGQVLLQEAGGASEVQ